MIGYIDLLLFFGVIDVDGKWFVECFIIVIKGVVIDGVVVFGVVVCLSDQCCI